MLRVRGLPVKVFALGSGAIVHVYYSGGSLEAAEVSYGGGANAAVVSTDATNVDVVRAAQLLRLRGSP